MARAGAIAATGIFDGRHVVPIKTIRGHQDLGAQTGIPRDQIHHMVET